MSGKNSSNPQSSSVKKCRQLSGVSCFVFLVNFCFLSNESFPTSIDEHPKSWEKYFANFLAFFMINEKLCLLGATSSSSLEIKSSSGIAQSRLLINENNHRYKMVSLHYHEYACFFFSLQIHIFMLLTLT